MKKKMTPEEVADKIVTELKEAGLTPYQMLLVIQMARKKYLRLKVK